jgi:4'-phosphopantetheinyl transferase
LKSDKGEGKPAITEPPATLWLFDADGVAESHLDFFAPQLGESENHRLRSFLRPQRRLQFLLGRMLLRFAVSNLTGLPADTIGMVERRGNAPWLILPGMQQWKPSFSISHSRNWVACLVSCGATLGVDIEVNDPARDIESMSEMLFSPSEHVRLSMLPDAERVAWFYHRWCEREALHKLLCNLGRESDSPALLSSLDARELENFGWQRYALPFPGLSIVAYSDRPLSLIDEKVLTGVNRADWLASARRSC